MLIEYIIRNQRNIRIKSKKYKNKIILALYYSFFLIYDTKIICGKESKKLSQCLI